MDIKNLWDSCLSEIEFSVSRPTFNTWFRHTSIVKEDSGVVYVGVPNEFVKDWLRNKHQKLILKTLCNFSESIRNVEFVITKLEPKKDTVVENRVAVNELPLKDLYINKEDNLNSRYVFDTFIVGPFNELAHAAAQAIIKNPGRQYNPFFVYGNTGLGKTHLIQAIGNSIKKNFPGNKVHYITLEKFSVDYVNAVQANKPNAFKEKYRKYDTIIIDDIQFITGREKTQEELFHLFNAFYDNNKQIIFSSDKHPNFISGLEDRLKSRFGAGMLVDIVEPDYESRLAIIKTKLKDCTVDISPDVVDYLATTLEGNIRELEGNINALICQVQVKGRLSLAEARSLLKNNIRPKKNVSVKDVVKVVSDFYNIEEESIYEKTRRKEIVHARQMIMYILREDFNVSYPLIGSKLGGKDHTTVIHSCLKIKNDLKNSSNIVRELDEIRTLFK